MSIEHGHQKVNTWRTWVKNPERKGRAYIQLQQRQTNVEASADHQQIALAVLGTPTGISSLDCYLLWVDVSQDDIARLTRAVDEWVLA